MSISDSYAHPAAKQCQDAFVNMKHGFYFGNGADNRDINIGIDLASKTHVWIIIKTVDPHVAVHRINHQQGDATFCFHDSVALSDAIQAFTSTGFQVGTRNEVNELDKQIYYAVLWED